LPLATGHHATGESGSEQIRDHPLHVLNAAIWNMLRPPSGIIKEIAAQDKVKKKKKTHYGPAIAECACIFLTTDK